MMNLGGSLTRQVCFSFVFLMKTEFNIKTFWTAIYVGGESRTKWKLNFVVIWNS